MNSKTIVVVGGVAGGMSFATRYRRLNQDDHIIILEKGNHVSFANCGLPYAISGEIKDRESLLVADQTMLQNRFQLDIRTKHEVVGLDSSAKTLKVRNEYGESTLSYDELVLSVGARPILLDIEGLNKHPGVFTLRNLENLDAIQHYLDTVFVKSVLVIGAGFIGLEMAENFRKRGMDVSIVEKSSHVLPPLDVEVAKKAERTLEEHDIRLYTSRYVARFEDTRAILDDGTKLEADLVLMSVGVRADTDFLQESSIELGTRGGIVVDNQFKTSIPNVYAVGDAIVVKHLITQDDVMIPLASPANRQGRQLADILSGFQKVYHGTLGTSIMRLFDLTFASTGLNERQLNTRNYDVVHILGKSHASYFPNAEDLFLKVIYDKDTHEILGAQSWGKEGVDKRIDVIATAIKGKLSVVELQNLELAYAPPYGSAKDIVNLAGYYAENKILNLSNTIQWHEIDMLQESGALIVDVREQEEIDELGMIEGAIHMPLDTLRCSMNQLPRDRKIITYCRSGARSYNAERILNEAGFDVSNFDGSYSLYLHMKDID